MSNTVPELTEEFLRFLCSSHLDASKIVEILAGLEVTAQIDSTVSEILPSYYIAYLLSLFLADDLNEARFLTQRIPSHLLTDHVLGNTIILMRALYSGAYPSIHSTLSKATWPAIVMPLRDRFQSTFRKNTFLLLAKAYTLISPRSACVYLGLEDKPGIVDDEIIPEWGYCFDHLDGLLRPGLNDESMTRCKDKKQDIGLLTSLVTHLIED